MLDPGHLEKMGRELKCPICLSLLNSAVSLTCNHVFCNPCIVKSMKSCSNCPVCKVPFQRREVRAAPHMDSLVSIYKSMEAASGFQLFVTQNPPSTKLSDEEKQVEGAANCSRPDVQRIRQDKVENQRMSKGNGSKKKFKSNLEVSNSVVAKPSFPAKKRVQVPQCRPSEIPTRSEKLEIKSDENIKDGFKNSSLVQKQDPVYNEKGEPVLSPFFWLRDDEDIETLSLQTAGSQFLNISPPHVPTFSDIKDSDDEYASKLSPEISESASWSSFYNCNTWPWEELCGKSNDADRFDSEIFEWTQRACSPELYSSPASPPKMQEENSGDVDAIQDGRQEVALLSLNINEPSLENDKCRSSEQKVIIADEEFLVPSANSQNANDKSNTRDWNARKAMLKRCVKNDAEQDHKSPKTNPRKNKQKEAKDNKGDSLKCIKTRKRRERTICGSFATEIKTESVVPLSIRGESQNFSFKKLDAELTSSLGKRQRHKDLRRNSGKICEKTATLIRTDKSSRSKKRKLKSIINEIEQISIAQNSEEREASPSEIDGRHIPNNKRRCQIHGKGFNSPLSPESNKKLRKQNKKVSFHGISEDAVTSDHKEDQNNISAKEAQFIEKVTDAFNKKTQSTEKVQSSSGSRVPNKSVVLGKLDRENGVVLQSCQTLSHKIQCAFCLSSEESEAAGEMVHYYNGKPVAVSYEGGSKVIHSHRSCAEWAPNVYFEDDIAINLEAELTRSRRIKCCCCGLKGAALGCYEKSCRKSFHVTCAKLMPQCRWDTINFVMLCPLHASSKLPHEDSIIDGRTKKKCNPKRKKSNQCDQVAFRQDVNTCSSWTTRVAPNSLVLCCSAFTVEEREIISEFQRLSGVTVLKSWDLSVTHVIASTDENGACKRTLKVLMGILEGTWILSVEWVKACMKAMKLVEEEPFEIRVDIHGIRDGPKLGRLRIMSKQPKIFEGLNFYMMGDFVASYKGYIQDLIVAGGGAVLHRKPLTGTQGQGNILPSTFIIYSIELPDICDLNKKEIILSRRRADAEALASATGAKAVTNSWILNSIAACRLQNFSE